MQRCSLILPGEYHIPHLFNRKIRQGQSNGCTDAFRKSATIVSTHVAFSQHATAVPGSSPAVAPVLRSPPGGASVERVETLAHRTWLTRARPGRLSLVPAFKLSNALRPTGGGKIKSAGVAVHNGCMPAVPTPFQFTMRWPEPCRDQRYAADLGKNDLSCPYADDSMAASLAHICERLGFP